MKFTTTNNTSYRQGIGSVPKSWIECADGHHHDAIHKYFYKYIKMHDWDICGDETHDFLFDDGKAYSLEYHWWSEWYHDDEEENGLKDKYHVQEIDPKDANVPNTKQRDWL